MSIDAKKRLSSLEEKIQSIQHAAYCTQKSCKVTTCQAMKKVSVAF